MGYESDFYIRGRVTSDSSKIASEEFLEEAERLGIPVPSFSGNILEVLKDMPMYEYFRHPDLLYAGYVEQTIHNLKWYDWDQDLRNFFAEVPDWFKFTGSITRIGEDFLSNEKMNVVDNKVEVLKGEPLIKWNDGSEEELKGIIQ